MQGGIQEWEEDYPDGNLAVSYPIPSNPGVVPRPSPGIAHTLDELEDATRMVGSSQTEPESPQYRVRTQGKPEHLEPSSSQTEPESSPVPNRSQANAKSREESSQTQPESLEWLVPTQCKEPPVDDSQTQPESLQWRVETQGPSRTPQKTTTPRVGNTPTGKVHETHPHPAVSTFASSQSGRDVPDDNREPKQLRTSWGSKLDAVRDHVLAGHVDTDEITGSPLPILSDFESSQSQSQPVYSGTMPTQMRVLRAMFPDSPPSTGIPRSP